MKNKFWLSILFLFLNTGIFSQSVTHYGWEWLNPLPTHSALYQIEFVNLNTGYCLGYNGTILKTTNMGINWYFLQTWVQPGLFDYSTMHVFNKDTLILIGNPPNFYKSTNGGISWNAINSGVQDIISGLYFRDNYTGYAVGGYGTVLKTNSGGNSWGQIYTGLNLDMSAVSFPDDNTGYIAGSKIVKTTNGGLNWDTSSAVTGAYSVYFHNSTTGFIGAYALYMTTNGGANWNDVSGSGYNFYSIKFINSQTGWASTDNGVMKTTNGGFNWNIINSNHYRSISFTDGLNGYGCSADAYGAIISRTSDGGINWNALSSKYETGDIYAIYFLNENTGFYGGTSGNLRKTTNGGHNWTTIFSSSSFIEAIYFFNENTGFIGQTSGYIGGQFRKTTNGGLNWVSFPAQWPVDGIMFADINTGYAITERGFAYKTTNGGSYWDATGNWPSWINGLYVINADRVVVVGEAVLARTTNGGQNWMAQNHNWGSSGYSVWFTDINTGFVACGTSGYGGRVLKTTNFGDNWSSQNLGNEYSLNAIQFFDANTGIVSGHNGTAFKTTNAGVNWMPYYRITDYHIFSMHCPNQNTCYFGGWYDIILKMSDGGILIGAQKQITHLPNRFMLSQNYPNPFNPVTKIKFSIPLSRGVSAEGGRGVSVSLTIYDILGREIATLLNERLSPGTYEVQWDGTNYPSGVYFYKLVVSGAEPLNNTGYSETRKMVLVK